MHEYRICMGDKNLQHTQIPLAWLVNFYIYLNHISYRLHAVTMNLLLATCMYSHQTCIPFCNLIVQAYIQKVNGLPETAYSYTLTLSVELLYV